MAAAMLPSHSFSSARAALTSGIPRPRLDTTALATEHTAPAPTGCKITICKELRWSRMEPASNPRNLEIIFPFFEMQLGGGTSGPIAAARENRVTCTSGRNNLRQI